MSAQIPFSEKKKIAILGGGVGAIVTAWQLTNEPDWQDRFDITIYQMGWRLGGKGASGRRPPHQRIEEHGLHIWLGFYHNAFRALQAAYATLNPDVSEVPAGQTPPRVMNGVFARCEDAFIPHNDVGVFQSFEGQPTPWMVDMPHTSDKPWEGDSLPSVWAYIKAMVQFLAHQRPSAAKPQTPSASHHDIGLLDRLTQIVDETLEEAEDWTEDLGWTMVFLLEKTVDTVTDDIDETRHNSLSLAIKHLLLRIQSWLTQHVERVSSDSLEDTRRLLLMDMFITIIRGLLEEDVHNGTSLATLDEDFRCWLQKHGALPTTCSLHTNPLLKGVYDFVFAFDEGNAEGLDATANFATAPALRTIFRMCFTYSGSIFWKMRAGMGDTIFTPFYKALVQRGVRFEFFHKVEALRLSADGQSIAAIDMIRQVNIANDGIYQPLVNVHGLDCWPACVQYDQLEQGDVLKAAEAAQGLTLESMWFDWSNAAKRQLRQGHDFDQVVFGISLGSIPLLCADLCAVHPTWQRMVDEIKTVCTMGVQFWLRPSLNELGWQGPSPVMDGYHEPLDTWADMSHLLPQEVWSQQNTPANIAYFCGALHEGPLNPLDAQTPHRALAKVQAHVNTWLDHRLADVWPAIATSAGGIDRSTLVDTYLRANIDPSERYVMSVAGSNRARLKANATGISNLVITGDWTDNGFNAGCVEAACMAGMQAANALLGHDLNAGIIGRELCA